MIFIIWWLASSQSFNRPEDMDLVTINLTKTTNSQLDKCKVIGAIPDEDIIDVFV